eukprot:1327298-Prymnesium_polylepis.1
MGDGTQRVPPCITPADPDEPAGCVDPPGAQTLLAVRSGRPELCFAGDAASPRGVKLHVSPPVPVPLGRKKKASTVARLGRVSALFRTPCPQSRDAQVHDWEVDGCAEHEHPAHDHSSRSLPLCDHAVICYGKRTVRGTAPWRLPPTGL